MSDSQQPAIDAETQVEDPEILALLDFEPVPRKLARANGWDAEAQRAFIAALAATGSPRRAAHEVGLRTAGVENLRKGGGAESFSAAWDRALELYAERRTARLRYGIARLHASAAGAAKPAVGTVVHGAALSVSATSAGKRAFSGMRPFRRSATSWRSSRCRCASARGTMRRSARSSPRLPRPAPRRAPRRASAVT